MKKYIITIALIILFTLPVWMWFAWLLEGKKELKVVIVDNTSITTEGNEHRSLNWILDHEKYSKADGSLYSIEEDYYGFFPKENKKFVTKGLEDLSDKQIQQLADNSDMTYFADTYGIYRREWYGTDYRGEFSQKIYGGMTKQDLKFLEMMKKQKKLILTEYNDIATPTSKTVRSGFENLFGVRWSGWAGRYFETLDTTIDKEIPVWLIQNYKLQHNNKWDFKNSGIAFVHENGRIEILDYDKDLKSKVPYILTNLRNQQKYGIPEKIKYSYWFDVMYTQRSNEVVSVYHIETNARGDSILNSINIPNPFPAVIEHNSTDYKFYYFCGDFCDNPIDNMMFSQFVGITHFRGLFYSTNDTSERKSFFWLYFEPMISKILDDYYNSLQD